MSKKNKEKKVEDIKEEVKDIPSDTEQEEVVEDINEESE